MLRYSTPAVPRSASPRPPAIPRLRARIRSTAEVPTMRSLICRAQKPGRSWWAIVLAAELAARLPGGRAAGRQSRQAVWRLGGNEFGIQRAGLRAS